MRIMQPQPLSEVKPFWSINWLLILTERERADKARGSVDLGIGSKSDLYVIQIFDSKSSRKVLGQPPSGPTASSYARDDEKLLVDEAGGVSGAFAGGTGAIEGRLGLEMS